MNINEAPDDMKLIDLLKTGGSPNEYAIASSVVGNLWISTIQLRTEEEAKLIADEAGLPESDRTKMFETVVWDVPTDMTVRDAHLAVFGLNDGPKRLSSERYDTANEAKAGHQRIVAKYDAPVM